MELGVIKSNLATWKRHQYPSVVFFPRITSISLPERTEIERGWGGAK